jgi:hypothetical protein
MIEDRIAKCDYEIKIVKTVGGYLLTVLYCFDDLWIVD